jgi:hypothetical protein
VVTTATVLALVPRLTPVVARRMPGLLTPPGRQL